MKKNKVVPPKDICLYTGSSKPPLPHPPSQRLIVDVAIRLLGLGFGRLSHGLVEQHLRNKFLALELNSRIVALGDALVKREFGIRKLKNVLLNGTLGDQPMNSQ